MTSPRIPGLSEIQHLSKAFETAREGGSQSEMSFARTLSFPVGSFGFGALLGAIWMEAGLADSGKEG